MAMRCFCATFSTGWVPGTRLLHSANEVVAGQAAHLATTHLDALQQK